jgi:flagellar motor protein MotB
MFQTNAFALRSLASIAANASSLLQPDYTIAGFPEYATGPETLAASQRQVLYAAGLAIAQSQSTFNPVAAAIIVGHSDKALRKPLGERAAFELKISQQRATAAAASLLRELVAQSYGAHYSTVFRHLAIGIGNGKPKFVSAVNEQQMQQNRRVEITLLTCPLGRPICAGRE